MQRDPHVCGTGVPEYVCAQHLGAGGQLLLTGNRWGPTAGLGWLGTGSKGTVERQLELQTRCSHSDQRPQQAQALSLT